MGRFVDEEFHEKLARVTKDVADYFRNAMIAGSLWALAFYTRDCGVAFDFIPQGFAYFGISLCGGVVCVLNILWFGISMDSHLFSSAEEAIGIWGEAARFFVLLISLVVAASICFSIWIVAAQFGSKSCG